MTLLTPERESLIQTAAEDGLLTGDSAENLRSWLKRGAVRQYHAAIVEHIDAGQWATLNELFWTAIPFGTGGRRGPMGPMGPATINDRTIAESAHGLASYLRSSGEEQYGAAVIAHDTRNQSRHFAELTASTLAAHGLKVYLFEAHRSTPELSYAVRELQCDIGVMISASHNPPADNGFKAYWNTGAQVIPPHDKGIIEQVEQAEEIPTIDFSAALEQGRIVLVGEEIDGRYIDEVASLSESDARDISAVFTPLHGVGETSVYEVIRKAGFEGVEIFEPHREPDGDFPNVPKHLPNPENLAVFDPVLDALKAEGRTTDLILASDPDADRLGVVARDAAGNYIPLTGNQVGALITDFLMRKRKADGRFSPDNYVVETLVTTPLTRAVAEGHGAQCIYELLVGFKYIAQTMEERGTENFVFGTEESIGFLAGSYCRDKDAAVCGLYILELAAELKQAGKTLPEQLEELHRQYGYHSEGQVSIYCEGPAGKSKIDGLMETLRTSPPAQFGPIRFVQFADYQAGKRLSIPAGEPVAEIENPRGNLLYFHSDTNGPVRLQIAARPSGTEPKIKFYFFCQSDLPTGDDTLEQARGAGDSVMQEVQTALKEWADQELAE